jgi:hypothetical protein
MKMSDKTRRKQNKQKTKLIESGTSSPEKRIIHVNNPCKMMKRNDQMQQTNMKESKENFISNCHNHCLAPPP